MRISPNILAGAGVRQSGIDRFLDELNQQMARHEIDTARRASHFLAQVLHESGKCRFVEENLNYSAEGLRAVFGKYFTAEEALRYARQPQRIASRAYANRNGNGDEASGDGYRYRGRGLIQLTGRSNYQRFGEWLGDADLVAEPDRVAGEFAVHSAVFYWSTHRWGLNGLADRNDLLKITRAINGGKNGLADRRALLGRLQQLMRATLEADDAATLPARPAPARVAATHVVAASALNLRSEPQVKPGTRIATLPRGTALGKLSGTDRDRWWRVQAELDGRLFEGCVASRHLAPLAVSAAERASVSFSPTSGPRIPPAHLSENRDDVTRFRDGGRAYPLGEAGRPGRNGPGLPPAERADELLAIVDYLDCENKRHRRWQSRGRTTYANIYVCDYCYLAGVYLPRVWWKEPALYRIRLGGHVQPQYDNTVSELSVNALYDWLDDYAALFGWSRAADIDELQRAANDGEVCILIAKHSDLNQSGAVVAVAPEHDRHPAARDRQGTILRPVESLADVENYRFRVSRRRWWLDENFRAHSGWRHA